VCASIAYGVATVADEAARTSVGWMQRCRVLIVGGGIGGLATAIAVTMAGHDVTVVEGHADVHSSVYGVGIIQPNNALRALDALGCARACLDAGFPATGWGARYDLDDRFVREIPGTHIEGYDFPPMNGVTRPRLHEILTQRARELGAEVRYSRTFAAFAQSPEGVDVTFSDGTAERVDVVVGADGVHSKVRPYVLDAGLEPRYIGQSAFRVRIPREPQIDRVITQKGPDGMAGFVLLHAEEALIAPPPWHRGRIVLIGDAVHAIPPHLGQGAAQAIEDGVVLGECLGKHDDLEPAFTEYTNRRYERCRLVVETSLAIAEWEIGTLMDFDHPRATQRVLESMAQPI
jgi:2-polyprenyl-6-methoxyphenol hydroxylase-like FAD-dependent oxidoreductase